jgi:hypothetical protein
MSPGGHLITIYLILDRRNNSTPKTTKNRQTDDANTLTGNTTKLYTEPK